MPCQMLRLWRGFFCNLLVSRPELRYNIKVWMTVVGELSGKNS
ncbi:hypothetical protein FAEPRAA2165_02378 [Faecalibacterium duncaniae]|uniref:Uncharacterized protein n=1 Tax=Faecalibacterium duncaniae (strain DSM 17677 / JCM 31915 / A2-165) TaxID=411483 RepID=C7H7U3_FAED2|nr:hypothetical protein FAEPRAA2165_02378 [Faecalibacterium duncaniae]